jgi:hypothetical protein
MRLSASEIAVPLANKIPRRENGGRKMTALMRFDSQMILNFLIVMICLLIIIIISNLLRVAFPSICMFLNDPQKSRSSWTFLDLRFVQIIFEFMSDSSLNLLMFVAIPCARCLRQKIWPPSERRTVAVTENKSQCHKRLLYSRCVARWSFLTHSSIPLIRFTDQRVWRL